MDVILRKSNENEIEKIVELSKKAFDTDVFVGGKGNDGPPQYDDINWHKHMFEEGHLYTCMQTDGEIIGGAILFEEEEKLYVGRIFINPEYFGQGYGMQLMREIEYYFPNASVIRLDTPIWNVRTNRFYRKCGYRQTGKDMESVYYEKTKK
ncbi:MAG: GNAT family N-acetyltransferase [Fusicatenibacter sp.]|nr:GNAT family N-acetyltransferase [Lachnospiraceae bacterium]MDY2936753.1 GNAT family N-acetyltransferase [Fusicatenibacter sp.]